MVPIPASSNENRLLVASSPDKCPAKGLWAGAMALRLSKAFRNSTIKLSLFMVVNKGLLRVTPSRTSSRKWISVLHNSVQNLSANKTYK